MLGSNIVAIPLMMTVAYVASRKQSLGSGDSEDEGRNDHERHRQEHLVRVKRQAVTLLAGPYVAILLLVAVLTLPAGWRGLQPIDGGIMALAYLVFVDQAVMRGRSESEDVQWKRKELVMAGAGFIVLAIGAYLIVRATENVVSSLGISRVVGGLFITAVMAATPEIFASWNVVRSGQVTAGTTSIIGDHAVTMTIAFVPLALVSVPIEDLLLYGVNIFFVTLMPVAYAVLIHFGSNEHGFKRWEVAILDILYLSYVGILPSGFSTWSSAAPVVNCYSNLQKFLHTFLGVIAEIDRLWLSPTVYPAKTSRFYYRCPLWIVSLESRNSGLKQH